MERNMLRYKDVAMLLQVPVGTVYAWVCRKSIPHVRFSGRCVRFDADEIQKWVDERRCAAADKCGRIVVRGGEDR